MMQLKRVAAADLGKIWERHPSWVWRSRPRELFIISTRINGRAQNESVARNLESIQGLHTVVAPDVAVRGKDHNVTHRLRRIVAAWQHTNTPDFYSPSFLDIATKSLQVETSQD